MAMTVGSSRNGEDRVDAVHGLVRVQPGGGADAVVAAGDLDGRGRGGCVAADVDHRGHPGGPGRGDDVVDRRHRACRTGGSGCRCSRSRYVGHLRLRRGTAARPSPRRGRPGTRPMRRRRAGAGRSTWPGRPMRSHTAWAESGTAGEARMATMRSASSASPMTASTAGPGSAFHGSLASRWALVARMRRPRGLQRAAGLHLVPRLGGVGVGLGGDGGERRVGRRCRADAVALLADDGGHAGEQVAQVVGQVAVVAGDRGPRT